MIDFYKKADEKKKGELDFVPDSVEQKIMLLLCPKKKEVKFEAPKVSFSRPRAFCDVYYERA